MLNYVRLPLFDLNNFDFKVCLDCEKKKKIMKKMYFSLGVLIVWSSSNLLDIRLDFIWVKVRLESSEYEHIFV